MTEKEKIEMYIANCKCCTLASCMKTCPTCIFNVGLSDVGKHSKDCKCFECVYGKRQPLILVIKNVINEVK